MAKRSDFPRTDGGGAYDQQARIDALTHSLGQLIQVQEGVHMTGIEATSRLKQAHAALKGSGI